MNVQFAIEFKGVEFTWLEDVTPLREPSRNRYTILSQNHRTSCRLDMQLGYMAGKSLGRAMESPKRKITLIFYCCEKKAGFPYLLNFAGGYDSSPEDEIYWSRY